MTSKKHYQVSLFSGANDAAEAMARLAIKSNGDTPLNLYQLEMVGQGSLIQYPTLNGESKVIKIGDSILHVDKKIGDDWKTVLIIREVEVYELEPEENIETVD